jgi:hypothetical protein
MAAMNTEFKTINREFKTVKIIVRPLDPLAKGEKTFGQVYVLMFPVNSSSMLLSILSDGTPCSFNQIKSMISNGSQIGTMISQCVKTLSGNFGYFEIDNDNDYFICVVSENYLQKKFLFTYPAWRPVTITAPDNNTVSDPEVAIQNVENKNPGHKNSIDRKIPLITIRLLPSPAYIFDSGMTIVRVLVSCKDIINDVYLPIVDAFIFFVKIENQTEKLIYVGRTDNRGQATLCCNRIGQDKIVQINGFTIDASAGIVQQKEFILDVFDNNSKMTKREKITINEFRMNTKEIILYEK